MLGTGLKEHRPNLGRAISGEKVIEGNLQSLGVTDCCPLVQQALKVRQNAAFLVFETSSPDVSVVFNEITFHATKAEPPYNHFSPSPLRHAFGLRRSRQRTLSKY